MMNKSPVCKFSKQAIDVPAKGFTPATLYNRAVSSCILSYK